MDMLQKDSEMANQSICLSRKSDNQDSYWNWDTFNEPV